MGIAKQEILGSRKTRDFARRDSGPLPPLRSGLAQSDFWLQARGRSRGLVFNITTLHARALHRLKISLLRPARVRAGGKRQDLIPAWIHATERTEGLNQMVEEWTLMRKETSRPTAFAHGVDVCKGLVVLALPLY